MSLDTPRSPLEALLAQGLARVDIGYEVRPAQYRFEAASKLIEFLDSRGFEITTKAARVNSVPGEIKINDCAARKHK